MYLRDGSAHTILRAATLEIEVADQTFYLTQSQYTDNGPTSPNADPITPGAWQGSHWSANFEVTGKTRPRKNPGASGIRTRDLPLSRRTPSHRANEAIGAECEGGIEREGERERGLKGGGGVGHEKVLTSLFLIT